MLYLIGILAILSGIGLDQYTKWLACKHLLDKPNKSIVLIKDVFQFQFYPNHGGGLGILEGKILFLLLVGVVAVLSLTILYVRMPKMKRYIPLRICLLSMIAGAIGNMIDRIRLQYVIDFLYFELIDFPIFNVADIFASVATCTLIVLFFFYYKDEDFDMIFDAFKFKKVTKND
jgi:signal peptidase II